MAEQTNTGSKKLSARPFRPQNTEEFNPYSCDKSSNTDYLEKALGLQEGSLGEDYNIYHVWSKLLSDCPSQLQTYLLIETRDSSKLMIYSFGYLKPANEIQKKDIKKLERKRELIVPTGCDRYIVPMEGCHDMNNVLWDKTCEGDFLVLTSDEFGLFVSYINGKPYIFDKEKPPSAWVPYYNDISMCPHGYDLEGVHSDGYDLDNNLIDPSKAAVIYGPDGIFVTAIRDLYDDSVYLAVKGGITMMVTRNGLAKYYEGPIDDFDPNKWDSYHNAHYTLEESPARLGIMYGEWIDGDVIPVTEIRLLLDGVVVYLAKQDKFTKMVTCNGVAKYYEGPISDFDPKKWDSYVTAGDNYKVEKCPHESDCDDPNYLMGNYECNYENYDDDDDDDDDDMYEATDDDDDDYYDGTTLSSSGGGKGNNDCRGACLTGEWIDGGRIPVTAVMDLGYLRVYIAEQGGFTKMVTCGGVAKYYTGPISDFDPKKWDSYDSAGDKFVLILSPDGKKAKTESGGGVSLTATQLAKCDTGEGLQTLVNRNVDCKGGNISRISISSQHKSAGLRLFTFTNVSSQVTLQQFITDLEDGFFIQLDEDKKPVFNCKQQKNGQFAITGAIIRKK